MENEKLRFQEAEKIMTYILIGCTALFIVFLFAAGFGVIWLKVISAIIAIIACLLCLVYLYMTKLLLRPRSIWMTLGAAALIVCILFSWILNFPSPL